jgi:hypothetical protein
MMDNGIIYIMKHGHRHEHHIQHTLIIWKNNIIQCNRKCQTDACPTPEHA